MGLLRPTFKNPISRGRIGKLNSSLIAPIFGQVIRAYLTSESMPTVTGFIPWIRKQSKYLVDTWNIFVHVDDKSKSLVIYPVSSMVTDSPKKTYDDCMIISISDAEYTFSKAL